MSYIKAFNTLLNDSVLVTAPLLNQDVCINVLDNAGFVSCASHITEVIFSALTSKGYGERNKKQHGFVFTEGKCLESVKYQDMYDTLIVSAENSVEYVNDLRSVIFEDSAFFDTFVLLANPIYQIGSTNLVYFKTAKQVLDNVVSRKEAKALIASFFGKLQALGFGKVIKTDDTERKAFVFYPRYDSNNSVNFSLEYLYNGLQTPQKPDNRLDEALNDLTDQIVASFSEGAKKPNSSLRLKLKQHLRSIDDIGAISVSIHADVDRLH